MASWLPPPGLTGASSLAYVHTSRTAPFYASISFVDSFFFSFYVDVNLKEMKPRSGMPVFSALAFQPHLSLTGQPLGGPKQLDLVLEF